MGAAVSIATGVVGIASSIAGTINGVQQSRQQAQAAQQGAALDRQGIAQDVEAAREDAVVQEAQRSRELRETLAAQRAILGGRGIDTAGPTTDAIAGASIEEAQRDVLAIRTGTERTEQRAALEMQTTGLRETAAVRQASAGVTRAYAGGISGIMSGASSIYSGVKAREEEQFIADERKRQSSRSSGGSPAMGGLY